MAPVLARCLTETGLVVLEVDRPDRRQRRQRGKSDPLDAEAAARAVQAGRATGLPKAGGGAVEAIRALRIARGSAMEARSRVANQLHALRVTAPDALRDELRTLSLGGLVQRAAGFRRTALADEPVAATRLALRSLARRSQTLSAEIAALDGQLRRLVGAAAPQLVARQGIGIETAGQFLVTAGGNPARLRNDGAFGMLTGTSPVPASSGKTVRHRLNRGGDRQANRALHMVVLSRMAHDSRTRAYVQRRTAEGKSTSEIMRCLKRYVAREVYGLLLQSPGLTT